MIWHYPHYGNQGGRPSSIIREGDWKLIHYYEDTTQVLYNIKNDLSETNDLSSQHPERVNALSQKLFDYLEKVNAKFPKIDPEYSSDEEAKYLKNIKTKKLEKLEQQRLEFLDPAFNPGNNWWGSQPK